MNFLLRAVLYISLAGDVYVCYAAIAGQLYFVAAMCVICLGLGGGITLLGEQRIERWLASRYTKKPESS